MAGTVISIEQTAYYCDSTPKVERLLEAVGLLRSTNFLL